VIHVWSCRIAGRPCECAESWINGPDADPAVMVLNVLLYGHPEGCPSCGRGDCPYHVPKEELGL